jgi:hypothetical protein
MTLPRSRAKSHEEWAWGQTRFHVAEARAHGKVFYRILRYPARYRVERNGKWVWDDWVRNRTLRQEQSVVRALRYLLEAVYGKGK